MRYILAVILSFITSHAWAAASLTPAFATMSSASGGSVNAGKTGTNTLNWKGAAIGKDSGGRPTVTITPASVGAPSLTGSNTFTGFNNFSGAGIKVSDIITKGPWIDPRAYPFGVLLDGVHDDSAGLQTLVSILALDGNQHVINLFGKTVHMAAPLQLSPGVSITNGYTDGSIYVGDDPVAGAYPRDFMNPQIVGIHFKQPSITPGSYALKYQMAHYAGNVRGCTFDGYDKAIWIPQLTVSTTTTQQVHRLTVEDNKYNNVNYFVKAEKPTTTTYGLADVHIVNNEGQAKITNIRLEGVDGYQIAHNTHFQDGFSTGSTVKENNVYIDYGNWGSIIGNHDFEAGLDAIYLSHVRNFSVSGENIAWPGQRAPGSGIRIINGDVSGLPNNIGSVTGNTMQQPSLSGITCDSNCSAVNIAGNTVNDAGYVLEASLSLPPAYYYGSTDLATLNHYGIDIDSQAQMNSAVGNLTPNNTNNISPLNRNSFAALNYDVNRNALIKPMPISLTATETTFSAAGVTQVNLAQTAATTISSISDGVEGQSLLIISFNGNTTLANSSTMKLRDGINTTLPTAGVLLLEFSGTAWREVSRNFSDPTQMPTFAGLTLKGAFEANRTGTATTGDISISGSSAPTLNLGRISPTSGDNTTVNFINRNGTTAVTVQNSTGNVGVGAPGYGANATNTIAVKTGVAPTNSPAAAFQLYATNWNGSNTAAPTFRTEDGGVVSLTGSTTTTAPSAGGAGGLPATPAGYLSIVINGTVRKLPYY